VDEIGKASNRSLLEVAN